MAVGEPVEVTAARTEYSSTMANPDGTYTLTQSTTPQRAKGDDGAWRDIDVSLEKKPDGTVGPKVAAVNLAFSGGGKGDGLLTLAENGRSLKLGWPGDLPAPTLDGPTATYANVFDGVDLQLTATLEGYREVLVVKSAEAAKNPALNEIKLSASGDGLSVAPGAGGGLRAVDADGNAIFRGPAGVMWDSAGDAAEQSLARTAAVVGDAAAEDDPAHPGDGDASAELPVKVESGAVSVTPDTGLLRGEKTVYPVYIDPPVGLGVSEWTKLSSDGDKFYKFDEPKGVGRCGVADGYACSTGGYTDRMYFEFGPGNLSGKYVLDATFRAYETWSFNCQPYWVDLERTENFGEGTEWPGPKMLDQMGDRYVSAGRGDLCKPTPQPNQWVEFNDNPDESDENLKSTVRAFADGKFERLTLMLKAKDESEPRAWKRFAKNAELQVVYVPKPGLPSTPGALPGTGTGGVLCYKSASSPLTVTTATPTLRATAQTKVQPKSGEEKGSLQVEFVMERGDDAAWHRVWSGYKPDKGSWAEDGERQEITTDNRADGGLYRFRMRTQSHWSFGTKSGDLFSSYTPWCYLKIDSTAPKQPQITSGGPYTQCTTDACNPAGNPGVPGTFTFKPNAADPDVKAYRYRLLTTSAQDTKEVSGTTVTVKDVTPTLSGTQVLSVEASDLKKDGEGRVRWGPPTLFEFKVKNAQGATGRWHFDDKATAGTATPTVAKDTGDDPDTPRHDAVLRDADGTGWSTLARRGAADYSLRLNDNLTDPAKRIGYASTDGSPVNTRDSFTVSAWAYLTDAGANHAVMTSPGEFGSAFNLYYSSAYKKWVFNRTAKDQDPAKGEPVYIRSLADTADPPVRVWTHLTGVFDTKGDTDKTNDTIQLFINGRPQGEPVVLSAADASYEPWTGDRNLQIGRSKVKGRYGEYFLGRLDEVAVWQRPLTGDEVRLEAAAQRDGVPTNELVAHWDASLSKGSEVVEALADPQDPGSGDFPYHRGTLKLSASGAVLDGADNALVLDGSAGYATGSGPVVDETGSFTVSATVKVNKTVLEAKPVGYRGIVAAQATPGGKESSWALWVEKTAAGQYWWKFGRTAVDATGTMTVTSEAPADEPIGPTELNTWVQITGVFDAGATYTDGGTEKYGKSTLYVGEFSGADEAKAGFAQAQQGTGSLSAGRGSAKAATGHHLPGGLANLRIWTGAMTADQIS
ncbi:LamG domain-containing protein, partial [Streptomyces sp. T-3]|nr:LamG domain-containing protein [Streptomyces sp. T-3]